jgi:hypothetical protein
VNHSNGGGSLNKKNPAFKFPPRPTDIEAHGMFRNSHTFWPESEIAI